MIRRWVTPLVFFASVAVDVRADEQAARRELAAEGLVQMGRFWVCPLEQELRRRWSLLGKQERVFFQSRESFNQRIERYQQVRKYLKDLQAALNENLERLQGGSLSAASAQQLEGKNQRIREQVLEFEREINKQLNLHDESSPVSEAAVALVNHRNALALSMLSLRRTIARIDRRYLELRRNEQVTAALARFGPKSALGPIERYQGQFDRLEKRLGPLVFADGVPMYRRSGQYRVSLIVGEKAAVTFSYTGPAGPTLVPASLLRRAGISLVDSGAAETLKVGDRTVEVRRVRLPSIRIGKHVVRNVQALVLPPEAEDLGARISLAALGELRAAAEEDRLWFRVGTAE